MCSNHCSHHRATLAPELMYAFIKRLLNQKCVGYISLALVCMMEYTLFTRFSFLLRDYLYEMSQPGLLYHAGSAHALFPCKIVVVFI